jgi:DNA-binding transcriptional LysR family regulator
VAHPAHPLHALGRRLDFRDLAGHRQIVVRDSARGARSDAGWLGAEERWTVSQLETSVDMIARGLGFAWLPAPRISGLLAADRLRELPLERGARRPVTVQLAWADSARAGPATRRLAELLRQQADNIATL